MTDSSANPETDNRIAVQLQCPDCLYQHYSEYVERISAGEQGCEFCTRPAGQLTVREYRTLIREARRNAAAVVEVANPRLDPGE